MDKIFSARLDESVLNKILLLSQKLRTTKKNIIETAIQLYAQRIETVSKMDVFKQTSGAWKRQESAQELIKKSRSKFNESFSRHQK